MAPENNPYQDIDLACRKLIFGNNKVCGITSDKDAETVANAGSRFAGLIFAEKSPRCITFEQAQSIITKTTAQLDYVGVFVNQKRKDIVKLVKELKLSAVQLHGNEDNTYIEALRTQLIESDCMACQIWQANSVNTEIPSLNEISDIVSHHVLDGKNPGSGQAFNWQILTDSQQDLKSCLLAGGLNTENINAALTQMNDQDLFGLDLNSGVECSPGVKSAEKLQQVFAKIRNY
jgi:indole-3-glycerol phosphate synthase/phosphoribosylanthranilate isomerase